MTVDEAYVELNAKEYMTDDELKNQYRKMMKMYHPDNFSQYGDDTAQQLAEEKSKQINEAYTLICDFRKNNAHLKYTQQTSYTQTYTQQQNTQQRKSQNNNRNSGRAQNYDYEREYNPEYTRHRATAEEQYNQEKQYFDRQRKERTYHGEDYENKNVRRHYNPNAGTPQRIMMKYILNTLMGLAFVIIWLIYLIGNFLSNVLSYPLQMLACATAVVDVGLWQFKVYGTELFIGILILALFVMFLPIIFNALSGSIANAIRWIGDFISIPANKW